MLRNLIRAYRWKNRRLRVWEARLQKQLQLLVAGQAPGIPCTLHVTSGAFYGGSIRVDRHFKQASIFIHIPHDRYLTSEERQVLAQYPIPPRALPYFILFHEYYHLLDTWSRLNAWDASSLRDFAASLQQSAQTAGCYRDLPVERQADEFAYEQYSLRFPSAG